jgi:hypothetical protein
MCSTPTTRALRRFTAGPSAHWQYRAAGGCAAGRRRGDLRVHTPHRLGDRGWSPARQAKRTRWSGWNRRMEGNGVEVIEVFPNASWTRWFGKRDGQSRAAWWSTDRASRASASVARHADQPGSARRDRRRGHRPTHSGHHGGDQGDLRTHWLLVSTPRPCPLRSRLRRLAGSPIGWGVAPGECRDHAPGRFPRRNRRGNHPGRGIPSVLSGRRRSSL